MTGRLLTTGVLLWCSFLRAAELEATVIRVVDGDTIWLQVSASSNTAANGKNPKPFKLRLQGIDAPELYQVWGQQASAALNARVLNQRVQVQTRSKDDYNRTLGNIGFRGEDISAWMVSQGHAWSYRHRRSNGPYAEEERAAKIARRGLFADPAAEEPRNFRKAHGACF